MNKSGALEVRLITALVILSLFVVLIWAPRFEFAFGAFIALLSGIGLYEYYCIVRKRDIEPETVGGIVAGTVVAFSGFTHDLRIVSFALYAGLALVAALHLIRGRHSLAGIAASGFGVAYIGWAGAHVTLLHGVGQAGPSLVTMLIFAVALTDAGAYFTGSLIGKHKLAPKVSPNKTLEGSCGGFLATIVGVFVYFLLSKEFPRLSIPGWGIGQFLFTGAVLSVLSQIGDLVESILKRAAGVKDSGSLFPGHGGVLDRCDGYLFSAPVLYYIVTLLFRV